MADYEALGEAFSALVNPDSIPGELGYELEDGWHVVDPDDPRKFLVRFASGTFVSALHKNRVLQIPGTPVLVGKDKQGVPVILGLDTSRSDAFFANGNGGDNVGLHDHVRNSGREFIIDTWLLKRLRTTIASGFTVQIDDGWYMFNKEIRYWTTHSIDLTSYKPTLSSYQRWVIVGINPLTDNIVAVGGNQFFSVNNGDRAYLHLPVFTQLGYIPIAAVWLSGEDTTLFNYRVEDLRFLPGSLIAYLENLYNVSGAYNYYGYSLSYDNGVWRGMAGGSAGGGGSPLTVADDDSSVANVTRINFPGAIVTNPSGNLVEVEFPAGAGIGYEIDDVANPPTNVQLQDVFPAAADGYAALLDDNDLNAHAYLTARTARNWNLIPMARSNNAEVTLISSSAHNSGGDGSINMGTYNEMRILSREIGGVVYQLTAWWNASAALTFGWRRTDTDVWTVFTTAITSALLDYHGGVSIGIDPDNIIHVCYDMHNDPLNYRRSTLPLNTFDGTLTSGLSMLGTNETQVSYPMFMVRPTDLKLFVTFRDGISGNAYQFFYAYDEGATTWSGATGTSTDGVFINGVGSVPDESAYLFVPVFDAAGELHFTWSWRRDGLDETSIHDLIYMLWNGTTFEKIDGSAQTIPVTTANDTGLTIAEGAGLNNLGRMDVDGNGHPHVALQKNDPGGQWNQFHVWHNGTAWVQTQVSFISGGAFYPALDVLQRCDIAVDWDTGTAYILFHSTELGDGMWMVRSTAADYSTWTDPVNIYSTDYGVWEESHDDYQWRVNKTLHFPIASWLSAGSNTMRLLVWSAARTREYQPLIWNVATRADAEGSAGLPTEVLCAYATDTNEIGVFVAGVWYWVSSRIAIEQEGVAVGEATTLNFIGANIDLSLVGTVLDIEIPMNINGLTEDLEPLPEDYLATYDVSATQNKKALIGNLPLLPQMLFSQIADKVLANTTTEGSLLTNARGRTELAANELTEGMRLHYIVAGYLSDTGTPTLTFRFTLNGVEVLTTSAITLPSGVTNAAFRLEADVICREQGASGEVIASGVLWYNNGTSLHLLKTTATSIDTTDPQPLEVLAQWGAASASNTLTIQQLTIEGWKPSPYTTIGDALLLESGDSELLESGDLLLLEG